MRIPLASLRSARESPNFRIPARSTSSASTLSRHAAAYVPSPSVEDKRSAPVAAVVYRRRLFAMPKTSSAPTGDPLRNSVIALLTTVCVALGAYATSVSGASPCGPTPSRTASDTQTR